MRIRVQAPIDRDAVSPDSIAAAQEYLINQMIARADDNGVVIDWNTFKTYTRRSRKTFLLVQWARVL